MTMSNRRARYCRVMVVTIHARLTHHSSMDAIHLDLEEAIVQKEVEVP